MTNLPTPYLPHNPGDLITAEDWNDMQNQIRLDIGNQIKQAVGDIKKVDEAGDADKLGGQTPQDLENDIVNQVLEKLAGKTGYQMIFKVLKLNEEKVIKHGLLNFPLVDVYQLDYFQVVCAANEEKHLEWVNFYIYHSDEKKIRFTAPGAATATVVDIEPSGSQPYKVLFLDMLRRYNVKYTDKSSIEDVLDSFWNAFFSDPNDRFSEDQFCHSPWFERCCREDNSVGELKDKGDLDDIWFQMRPKKTINYPVPAAEAPPVFPLPHNVQVSQADFSTLVVKLLLPPVYPDPPLSQIDKDQLKVMLLLKV